MPIQQTLAALLTIGIAGVSIPGAVDCISKINQLSSSHFSDHTHPNILLHQPNFSPMARALHNEEWNIVLDSLLESVNILAKAGADFVIIPANSVHKVISELQQKSPIPVLNMLEIVCDECRERKITKIGILGTVWTMSGHLYKDRMEAKGIEEVIPSEEEQKIVQNAIFSELIPTGSVSLATLNALLAVVQSLKQKGCDGIALVCTELPLVLNDSNCGIPVIDSTDVLAKAALKKAVIR